MTAPYVQMGAPTIPTSTEDDEQKKKNAANPPGNATDGEGLPGKTGGAGDAVTAAPGIPSMPPTFSQLQQAGYARPAPPTPAVTTNPDGSVSAAAPAIPTPTFGVTPAATPALGAGATSQAGTALSNLLMNPSGYANGGLQAELAKQGRAIDDEFAMKDTALREEMLRRGLSDSSIMGGRLKDLSVAKRSAQQGIAETLGIKAAESSSADQRAAIALALQKEGMDADTAYREAGMRVQADQFAQTLGLNRDELAARLSESAKDRALQERSQTFNEGMAREDLGLRKTAQEQAAEQFAKTFGFNLDQFNYGKTRDATNDAYRAGRDAKDDAYRADTLDWNKGQDLWNRGFQTTEADRADERAKTSDAMQLWQLLMGDYFTNGSFGRESAPYTYQGG